MDGLNLITILKNFQKKDWLMFALCTVVINMSLGGVHSRHTSFANANFINILELTFFLLYMIVLREFPPILNIIRNNIVSTVVIASWCISITYSLLNSHLLLAAEDKAWSRLFETFTHILFFVFVWDFFKRYQPELKWLFYTIPLSSIIIVGYFIYEWSITPHIENLLWLENPPFNSHIRHTGYQVEAALCFFLVFFFGKDKFNIQKSVNVFFLVILWGFIFWLGGRGAILSISVSIIFIFSILKYKKINSLNFILINVFSVLLGALISEFLVLFDWNGLLSSFYRSVEAESLNQLSTNRITLWKSALFSLNENLFFGLGPQGYYFMDNRIYGVQPHNVFIQFLVEWGLIGALLFIFLLIKAFWTGLRLHISNANIAFSKYSLISGAVILALSVNSLFDGTYYHPQPSVYLAIAFAIWIIPPVKKSHG